MPFAFALGMFECFTFVLIVEGLGRIEHGNEQGIEHGAGHWSGPVPTFHRLQPLVDCTGYVFCGCKVQSLTERVEDGFGLRRDLSVFFSGGPAFSTSLNWRRSVGAWIDFTFGPSLLVRRFLNVLHGLRWLSPWKVYQVAAWRW